MSASLFAAQEAVYGALSSDATLKTLIGDPARLYDQVPPAALFPYVTLGDVVLRDFDTKDRSGFEQSVTLHIWSRYRGRKELKEIMNAVHSVLHGADLNVDGADYVDCRFQTASTNLDGDGLTFHGVMRFRMVVQL